MRQLRNLLAWICLISASITGLYSGIYKMLYLAIINACMLYDTGVLSATIIAKTVFSCLCSPVIICGWAFIGLMLFAVISEYD